MTAHPGPIKLDHQPRWPRPLQVRSRRWRLAGEHRLGSMLGGDHAARLGHHGADGFGRQGSATHPSHHAGRLLVRPTGATTGGQLAQRRGAAASPQHRAQQRIIGLMAVPTPLAAHPSPWQPDRPEDGLDLARLAPGRTQLRPATVGAGRRRTQRGLRRPPLGQRLALQLESPGMDRRFQLGEIRCRLRQHQRTRYHQFHGVSSRMWVANHHPGA